MNGYQRFVSKERLDLQQTKASLRRVRILGKTLGGWYLLLRRLMKAALRRRRSVESIILDGQELNTIDYMGFEVVHRVNTSIVNEIQYVGENFEPDFLKALVHEISRKKPALMLDIGANIGLISLPLLRKFKKLSIVAFEPGPVQANCLAHTIARNKLSARLTLLKTAVGRERGDLDFFVHSAEHASGDGFRDTGRAGKASRITVPCITLDDWWNSSQRPTVGVIKIDVEGAEHWVLQGGASLLARCRPTVFYEVCLENSNPYPHTPFDTIELLNKQGYSVYDPTGKCVDVHAEACAPYVTGMYAARPRKSD